MALLDEVRQLVVPLCVFAVGQQAEDEALQHAALPRPIQPRHKIYISVRLPEQETM